MMTSVVGTSNRLVSLVRRQVLRFRAHRERRRERYAACSLASDDDGDSTPEELERLTGMSKEDYERRLLVAVRETFMGEWTVGEGDRQYIGQGALEAGSVDDVRMEGDGLDVEIVVLFRVDERPGRVFGWRMPVWPTPTPDPDDYYTGPEGWADLLAIELREDRDLVVPRTTGDPDPDGITWLGR
jgi:hypothetical protein